MGGGFIISAKKMGQCVPSSETSEILWKKSNVFRKISDVFWKKSNVFQKISNVFRKIPDVFAARSEVGTLVGVFLGSKCRAKGGIARSIRGENGRFRGGGNPLFQPFNQSKIAVMCDLC